MTEQPPVQPIESTSDDRLWALIAYLLTPISPVILLLLEEKKSRPYIKYHTMQALGLGIVLGVINIALFFVVIGFCTSFLTLGLLIFYGIKAYQGEVFEIPVVTKFIRDQGWT